MRVPKRRSEQDIKRDTGPVYVTPAAIERMRAQLDRCERELPAAIAEVERAKEYGDFSENAEYQDAKSKMRRLHTRIATLKDRIEGAVMIKKGANAMGIVQLGSTVVVEISGTRKTFEILGSLESDPGRGRISYRSPLGEKLMGRRVGDIVTIQTKQGSSIYRILEIT